MLRAILVILFFVSGTNLVFSQSGPSGSAFAEKVANRLRDSLGLSSVQRDSIYAINVRLLERSQAVRARNLSQGETQVALQLIENSRDSLYKRVIGTEKFLLYKPKKIALVFSH